MPPSLQVLLSLVFGFSASTSSILFSHWVGLILSVLSLITTAAFMYRDIKRKVFCIVKMNTHSSLYFTSLPSCTGWWHPSLRPNISLRLVISIPNFKPGLVFLEPSEPNPHRYTQPNLIICSAEHFDACRWSTF